MNLIIVFKEKHCETVAKFIFPVLPLNFKDSNVS